MVDTPPAGLSPWCTACRQLQADARQRGAAPLCCKQRKSRRARARTWQEGSFSRLFRLTRPSVSASSCTQSIEWESTCYQVKGRCIIGGQRQAAEACQARQAQQLRHAERSQQTQWGRQASKQAQLCRWGSRQGILQRIRCLD